MGQIKDLLDRIQAVHEEIQTVNSNLTLNCRRYFPPLQTIIGAMPLISMLPPAGEHNNETYGSDNLHSVWRVEIRLAVDNFFAGASPADAQANAETCMEHLIEQYWKRPRLELLTATSTQSAGAYANILGDARLRQSSDIQVVASEIALVSFTLTVETVNDIERL